MEKETKVEALLDQLVEEIVRAQIDWELCVRLYATSEEDCNLLNNTGGGAFAIMQEALYKSVALRICRLLDPPGSGDKKNITIARLLEFVDDSATEVKDQLESLLKKAKCASQRIKMARNKTIAHHDERTSAQYGQTLGYSSEEIQRCFVIITDYIKVFCMSYNQSHRDTRGIAGQVAGNNLLNSLKLKDKRLQLTQHPIYRLIIHNHMSGGTTTELIPKIEECYERMPLSEMDFYRLVGFAFEDLGFEQNSIRAEREVLWELLRLQPSS